MATSLWDLAHSVLAYAKCEEAEAAAEEPEAEAEEEAKPDIVVKTAPFDPRFPTMNQTKHCYTRYNEYHKCLKEKGDDCEDCQFYARAYRTLCPGEWVEKWNEERENGNFAGKY